MFIFTEKISKRSILYLYSSYKTHEKNFDENTESKSGTFLKHMFNKNYYNFLNIVN